MIISISGQLGSGKSTVAKSLANKLELKHYSTGDFWRELAAKRNMDVYEYNKLAETDTSIDKEIDEYSATLGKKEDNFVMDSRLAWHFIPHSFKVRLIVNPEEGARRIFEQAQREDRGSEKQHTSTAEAAEANKKREASETQRYIDYYNIDIADPKNFDLIVDSTNTSPEEIVEKIIKALPEN